MIHYQTKAICYHHYQWRTRHQSHLVGPSSDSRKIYEKHPSKMHRLQTSSRPHLRMEPHDTSERNRATNACVECRKNKKKCISSSSGSNNGLDPCVSCLKRGTKCVRTVPRKRGPQRGNSTALRLRNASLRRVCYILWLWNILLEYDY